MNYKDATPEKVIETVITENTESEHCAYCGGKCCKNMPCEIYPQDVVKWAGLNSVEEITPEHIIHLLNTGFVAMDWWDGDVVDDMFEHLEEWTEETVGRSHCLYLRMRALNDAYPIHGSYGGTCVLWSNDGCPIKFAHRPTGATALIPKPYPHHCESELGKPFCALAWLKLEDVMEEVDGRSDEVNDDGCMTEEEFLQFIGQ